STGGSSAPQAWQKRKTDTLGRSQHKRAPRSTGLRDFGVPCSARLAGNAPAPYALLVGSEGSMADKKGVDPFEAFKQKKAGAQQAKIEQDRTEQAAKALGWVDGIGPAGDPVPNMPKG